MLSEKLAIQGAKIKQPSTRFINEATKQPSTRFINEATKQKRSASFSSCNEGKGSPLMHEGFKTGKCVGDWDSRELSDALVHQTLPWRGEPHDTSENAGGIMLTPAVPNFIHPKSGLLNHCAKSPGRVVEHMTRDVEMIPV